MSDMSKYYGAEGDPHYGEEKDDEASGVWVTRKGEQISISGMSSRHLINAIAYLEREADAFEQIQMSNSNPFAPKLIDLEDNPRYVQLVAERERRRELDGEEI